MTTGPLASCTGRWWPLGVGLTLILALAGDAAGERPAPEQAGASKAQHKARGSRPFVRVVGTQFQMGAKSFYFVGANLNVMHGPKARAQMERTVAEAAADGLTVGRIWAFGEGPASAPSWSVRDNLFRAGPDGWQERAFEQLDRVIAAAGRHGLRLIITLSNSWADYGGIPMYLRWAKQRDTEAYGFSDRFFVHPLARRFFRQHLRRIVGRINSVTGLAYRDDPTVMAWELQNELSGTEEAAPQRRAWIQEMSDFIRSMDPNHLVVPGTLGYDMRRERNEWIRICQLPQVSYCDHHLYPEERLLMRGAKRLAQAVDDRVQLAHYVVGKPIVFGEYGFSDRGRGQRRRARKHSRLLSRLFFDGGNGALVWIYQPTLSWRRRYGVLVDNARYRPLRRTFSKWAKRVGRRPPENRNRRLGKRFGSDVIGATHGKIVQRKRPHRRWKPLVPVGPPRPRSIPYPKLKVPGPLAQCRTLAMPVAEFHTAYFEQAGYWAGGVLLHAYGRRTGYFEYRFTGPPFVPARAWIQLRLSSEYPGSKAPAHGGSDVSVYLDRQLVAKLDAPPDDGRGRAVRIPLIEKGILKSLRHRTHRLRFVVEAGRTNGIALYGREAPDNREPLGDAGAMQIVACP